MSMEGTTGHPGDSGYWYGTVAGPSAVDLLQELRRYRESNAKMRLRVGTGMDMGEKDLLALRHLMAADARGETLRQRDLAALLGISPASTSALVDRLVRDGHVRRAPHPGDRRSTAVLPTEHGHHEVRETLRLMHERMLAVAASLDEQERAVVLRFLQRLNHDLHHDVEQAAEEEGRHVTGPSSPDDPPEDADGLSARPVGPVEGAAGS